MAITIADIANDCGVSVSTVSRVINDSKAVSDELKAKVLHSVKKLHYKPNAAARSLITKKTDVIAVVQADLNNTTTTAIIKEIDNYCGKQNKVLMVCDYDYDNAKAVRILNNLLERQVDGLIFMGVQLEERILSKLREFSCPVILAQQGVEAEQCEFTTVTDDSYHAARDVTNFLVTEGHTRMAYIGGKEQDCTNGKLRLRGFMDAMKENDLSVPESYVIQGDFSIKAGMEGMQQIYENNLELPTAIVAGSDTIAVGIIRYLKTVKIRVPEDISVFGYDDSVSNVFEIPLSTVRSYDRGKILCEQLFKENQGKQKKWIYYPYRVLRRNSTKKWEI